MSGGNQEASKDIRARTDLEIGKRPLSLSRGAIHGVPRVGPKHGAADLFVDHAARPRPILGIPRALTTLKHVADELPSQDDLTALPNFRVGVAVAGGRLLPWGLLRQRLGRQPGLNPLLRFVPLLGSCQLGLLGVEPLFRAW